MAHFSICHKCDHATYIVDFFFQEIVRFHGIPRTIALERDINFLHTFRGAYGD